MSREKNGGKDIRFITAMMWTIDIKCLSWVMKMGMEWKEGKLKVSMMVLNALEIGNVDQLEKSRQVHLEI